MNNVVIFPLEPLDNRYTKQWYDNIPDVLKKKLGTNQNNIQILNISGKRLSENTTKGAFLNFSDTNYWKSSQLCEFVNHLEAGIIGDDDVFLFTDFWNPVIIQIAYMRDLLDKNWKIHGIAHAGAYDPSDILGYKMRKPWPKHFEQSLFYASDVLYFASDFHRQMFLKNLSIPKRYHDRAVLSGQPHDMIVEHIESLDKTSFQDRRFDVVWPHRYNDDKQPAIAEDLSEKNFNVLITQNQKLSKSAYYSALADSRVVFSCALHENLGISVMEGVLAGAIPYVPDRCSYSEMYLDVFKYPSEWTESYENYLFYQDKIIDGLNNLIQNSESFEKDLQEQREILKSQYLKADKMIECLLNQ